MMRSTETTRRNFLKIVGLLGVAAAMPVRALEALMAEPPPLSNLPAATPFRVVIDGHSYGSDRIDISTGIDYNDPLQTIGGRTIGGRGRVRQDIKARLILADDDLPHLLPLLESMGRVPLEMHVSDMGRWYDVRFEALAMLTGWSHNLPDPVTGEHTVDISLRIDEGGMRVAIGGER